MNVKRCSIDSFDWSKSMSTVMGSSAMRLRPTLLITGCNEKRVDGLNRRSRDQQLLQIITETIRRPGDESGDVLICSDSAGRVLEILLILNQAWQIDQSVFQSYPLIFLSYCAYDVVDFAKSIVEWMGSEISAEFENHRQNSFILKHVKLCHNEEELNRIASPKVIVSSSYDLENGLAKRLFVEMCKSPRNSIVLTEKGDPFTLSHYLIEHIQKDLEDEELDEYWQSQNTRERSMSDSLDEATVSNHRNEVISEVSEVVEATADIATFPLPELPRNRSVDNVDDEFDDDDDETAHDIRPSTTQCTDPLDFRCVSHDDIRLFSCNSERVQIDHYGTMSTPGSSSFLINQSSFEEQFLPTNLEPTKKKQKNMNEVIDPTTLPGKQVIETVTLDIVAKISFIDFEGTSNIEDVKRVIREIRPRNLAVVHSIPRDSDELLLYFNQIFPKCKGHTPDIGDTLDITQEKNMFQITLNARVMAEVSFKNPATPDSSTESLAWIEGRIKKKIQQNKDVVIYVEDASKSSKIKQGDLYSLDRIDENVTVSSKRKAIFVKEPKLSELKVALALKNIRAEFVGGVLLCEDKIALRKNEMGKISIEGPLSEIYFTIRSIVYQSYAII